MKIAAMIVGFALTGCGASLATDIGIVAGGLPAVQCGIATWQKDEAETPPPSDLQVAIDIAEQCGMDVLDFANAFGANNAIAKAAQGSPTKIHTAAVKFHAAKK